MALKSMTGFARAQAQAHGFWLAWEAKSVNGKGLDVRARVPSMLDGLDLAARKRAGERLGRGSVYLTLSVERAEADGAPGVNDARLAALIELSGRLAAAHGDAVRPASIGELLALRGVMEAETRALDDATRAGLETAALAALDQALDALVAAREQEGASLGGQLAGHLDTMAELVARAGAAAAARPEAVKARFAARLAELMGSGDGVDPQRLEQELALLAIKADVREELDRLDTHLGTARALLAADEPVGRRLDFLAQEFNREANTLCSKAQDADLTALGLELKTVIDQWREQIQNVE
ncbi:YicC family protein [Rhodothalassium salexigens]|uniref:YicC/YloC family endoribonuclease n=1 Tax=Rhodothalassium salexigens TaxID=1086 RepID=UPI001912D606|nr:YicC/YloC family endoribonuclease [Rhodothalassium salexigens]MBK5911591.1 YicC family protein [Rhodothalassium salexigens]